jgi:predicted nucleotidyltransferase
MLSYQTSDVRRKLDIIKEAVLQVVPNTEAIYLFGSYAYGNPNQDSDLDICVIVPDSVKEHPLDIAVDMRMKIPKNFDSSLDILVKLSSKYNERTKLPTLDRTIHQRGIKFYEQDTLFPL